MPSEADVLSAARRLLLDFEAFLFPIGCLACQRPGAVFCELCANEMRGIAPPRCGRCGQTLDAWEPRAEARARHEPVLKDSTAPASCGFCRSWPEAMSWASSVVWFEHPSRELVHALKYGGWTVAARPMAAAMARRLASALSEVDVLVPIPLGRRRLRERGHNQAELLARELGALIGVPVSAHALVRGRETKTQTALHPSERQANVAGAFAVRGAWDVGRGKNVVLVDDVLTTGATLCAAAQALAGAGAARVGAITFARAPKPA